MLRLAAALLARRKKPLPVPSRGRGARSPRRTSKSSVKKRTPSPARRSTTHEVKAPQVRSSTTATSSRGITNPTTSNSSSNVTRNSTAAVAEASTHVIPTTGAPVVASEKKPPYCLATAVSTIIVPPSANHLLEGMRQILTPSVQRSSDGGVGSSSSDEGRGPVSQMEEFYTSKKGPLFATAVIAGTNAVKQASQLIPFCHPMRIQKCSFTFRRRVVAGLSRTSNLPHRVVLRKRTSPPPTPSRARSECSVLYCFCTVATDDLKTGVEIEALTGANVAALTLYDMLKGLPGAQEDGLGIGESFVLAKRGGRNDFTKLLVSEAESPPPTQAETVGLLSQGQAEEEVAVEEGDENGDNNDDDDKTKMSATAAVADIGAAEEPAWEPAHILTTSPSPPPPPHEGGMAGQEEQLHPDLVSRTPEASDTVEAADQTADGVAGDNDAWWKSTASEKRMHELYPRRRYEEKVSSTTPTATSTTSAAAAKNNTSDVRVVRKGNFTESKSRGKRKVKLKVKVMTGRRASLADGKKRAVATLPKRQVLHEASDATGDDKENYDDANAAAEAATKKVKLTRAARARAPVAFSAAVKDERGDVVEYDEVEQAPVEQHPKKTMQGRGKRAAVRLPRSSSDENSPDDDSDDDTSANVDDPYEERLDDVGGRNEVEEEVPPPPTRQPRTKMKEKPLTHAPSRGRRQGSSGSGSSSSSSSDMDLEMTMPVKHDSWDNETEVEYDDDQDGYHTQGYLEERRGQKKKKKEEAAAKDERRQQQHRGKKAIRSGRPQRHATRRESKMTHCANHANADGSRDIGDVAWRAKLTPQQFHVLRMKGTDPRFGQYDNHFEVGEYCCAACGALLYTSAMKFRCTCGWPAFWDCLPLAVREEPDADGMRTEILCNACNSHLGHVFRGEGFQNPAPNERHCVNSTSICFRPQQGA